MAIAEGLDKFISEISGGEFSSYTKFMQAYGASCRCILVSYKCNKVTVFKSGK